MQSQAILGRSNIVTKSITARVEDDIQEVLAQWALEDGYKYASTLAGVLLTKAANERKKAQAETGASAS